MDAIQIAELAPALERYLTDFDDCFRRSEPMAHLRTYIKRQLSDLPRKSVEPMALGAGTPPRTLQQFLADANWDQGLMRQKVQRIIARDHAQLDTELFLPGDWSLDRERCRECGIPDEVVYRPKWKIALDDRGQRCVAEVPSNFAGWCKPPASQRADGPGSRGGEILSQARRTADPRPLVDRRPQHDGPFGGQVLRQQRPGRHTAGDAAARGIQPRGGRAVLRGPEDGTGPGPLRGPPLQIADPPPGNHLGDPVVSGRRPTETPGGKNRWRWRN